MAPKRGCRSAQADGQPGHPRHLSRDPWTGREAARPVWRADANERRSLQTVVLQVALPSPETSRHPSPPFVTGLR